MFGNIRGTLGNDARTQDSVFIRDRTLSIHNIRDMRKLTGSLLLIGGGADSSDFRYVTGFRAVDPVVFIRHKAERTLIVPAMEKGRALREVKKGIRVLAVSELITTRTKHPRISDWIVAYAKSHRIGHFVVSAKCPVGIVESLRRRGLSVSVFRGPIVPEREFKTRDEIHKIAAVQQAAVAALGAAINVLARCRIAKDSKLVWKGKEITAEDMRAIIAIELLRRGCSAEGTIVACGAQSADPHEEGRGPLRAHAPIILDIFPRDMQTGYWGDLTRTVVRGRASEPVRRMFAAVRAAQVAVMRAARPGVKLADLHALAQRELEGRGFRTQLVGQPSGFIHSTGHGVGLDIHEAPAIAKVKGRLRQGHVVTIEPGLYYPEVGGVRIEDTVVIGSRGAQLLARAPYRLEI